jgi:hypothetical protein
VAGGAATNGFVATATGVAGFGDTTCGLAVGATAATRFFGGALAGAVLAVGLRAGDLAFLRGARLAATVFADFFVVFFAAVIFVFFDFFAIFVFLIVTTDFPNHAGQPYSACNGSVRLSTQLGPQTTVPVAAF